MSSITKLPNGRRAIHYYGSDDNRRTLRLGKVSIKDAQRIRLHIDELLTAQKYGRNPNAETEGWLLGISSKLFSRIERAGLTESRLITASTLERALAAMIKSRSDWTVSQRRAMTTSKRHLCEFFGGERSPGSITVADAKSYRAHLVKEKFAQATISKQIKSARSYFRYMVDARMIKANPFTAVKAGSQQNQSRFFFVTPAATEKLIKACPNDEWRVIIALARYCGIRMPSELLPLKWSDIDPKAQKIRVTSPKTAGKGKSERYCPLWPRVAQELNRLAAGGVEPQGYVIDLQRMSAKNYRVGLLKLMEKAGLEPWPKIWQNMRSSCATQLIEEGHAAEHVARWIGNTPQVLRAHYDQARDEQYGAAVSKSASLSASLTAPQGPSQQTATRVIDSETQDPGVERCTDAPQDGPSGMRRGHRIAGYLAGSGKSASNSASRRDEFKKHPAPVTSSFRKITGLTRKAVRK